MHDVTLKVVDKRTSDGSAEVDQAERPVGYVMLNLVIPVQILHNFGAVTVVGSRGGWWLARG